MNRCVKISFPPSLPKWQEGAQEQHLHTARGRGATASKVHLARCSAGTRACGAVRAVYIGKGSSRERAERESIYFFILLVGTR
jgi:hypothetical protein